jgi:phosphatidate cytidylyltransferase
MGLLVALRGLGEGGWGLAAVLTTVLVTKGADTGAYFIGRALGRRKLVPRLSPGKTWEGAIGGIAAATLAAWICLQWLFPAVLSGAESAMAAVAAEDTLETVSSDEPGRGPALWWAVVLGPALALAGMVGDLAESLVKRSTGVKDSGDWLPGLGGMWDVTDSLIAAVAPAFLCFAAAV